MEQVKFKASTRIESFVSSEGKEVSTINMGDVVSIPVDNARVLESKGAGAIVHETTFSNCGFITATQDADLKDLASFELEHPEYFPNGTDVSVKLSTLKNIRLAQTNQRLDDVKRSEKLDDAVFKTAVRNEYQKIARTLDDCGNAKRMCMRYWKEIRHCEEFGKWFIWDGCRWKEDRDNTIYYLAKKVIKSIYNEAAECENEAASCALAEWAHDSSSNFRIRAMIESTKSEHDSGIPITSDVLDRDDFLITLKNGTFNMVDFKLLPFDQKDMITKQSPAEYNPESDCPTWIKFLDRIFKNQSERVEIISFLQRCCGYSLTGDTKEQTMFLLYGGGANGKSTFLDVIQFILGDYAGSTESATFTTARGEAVRNDIARLTSLRFVSASENTTDSVLDEALIKKLTGGEKITARFLHKEYFEFYPKFKIWWAFNHQPKIKDTTDSIWRRIFLVPFNERIPADEQDKTLAIKLRNEASGILNWMIQGLKEYNKIGLNPPACVVTTTKEYREDQDILHDFIEECCIYRKDQELELSGDVTEYAKDLYLSYESWHNYNGGSPKDKLSSTKFGILLSDRGFKKTRDNKGKKYHGIKLKRG